MDSTGPSEVPNNNGSGSSINLFAAGYELLERFGWFIVIGGAVFTLLWRKYLAKRLEQILPPLSNGNQAPHHDPNAVLSRHEAMLAARERMQSEQDRLSAAAREAALMREEEKRKQKIEEWERHKKGGELRNRTHFLDEEPSSSEQTSTLVQRKGKKALRDDGYNPLSGSGGGSSYRPSRRSCCPSGGCG